MLAIRYIETGRGIPPVRFEELVDAVAPAAIRPGIGKLLKQKRATSEMGRGKQIPELGRFIEAELDRHGESFSGQGRPDLEEPRAMRAKLNGIFRKAVAGEGLDE